MKLWRKVIASGIAVVIIGTFISHLPPESDISCGEGTIEVERECVLLDRIQREGVTDIYIDFLADEYRVEQGDSVRLIFDDRVYDHYIPERFVMDELGLDLDLSERSLQIIEFNATEQGALNYTSTGNCRVLIPGAGEVKVDCQIYCGETDNGRSGTIIIT